MPLLIKLERLLDERQQWTIMALATLMKCTPLSLEEISTIGHGFLLFKRFNLLGAKGLKECNMNISQSDSAYAQIQSQIGVEESFVQDYIAMPRRQRRTSLLESKKCVGASIPINRFIDCKHEHNDEASTTSLLDQVVDFDVKFSAWIHEQGLELFFYLFLRTLEYSGASIFLISCVVANFVAPKSKHTPEVRKFFFNLFMAFLFDLIFVSIIKKVVCRPCPTYNHNYFMTMQVDHWSFPSGHSTKAFLVVTMFILYMPLWKDQSHKIWLPYLQQKLENYVVIIKGFESVVESIFIILIGSTIIGWAIATITSRIILGQHFFGDVVAGSFLGIVEALFFDYFLTIPIATSEIIFLCINMLFSWIEFSTWRLFHWEGLQTFQGNKTPCLPNDNSTTNWIRCGNCNEC